MPRWRLQDWHDSAVQGTVMVSKICGALRRRQLLEGIRHSAAHDIVAVLPQLINLRFERVSRLDTHVARREVGVGTERAT